MEPLTYHIRRSNTIARISSWSASGLVVPSANHHSNTPTLSLFVCTQLHTIKLPPSCPPRFYLLALDRSQFLHTCAPFKHKSFVGRMLARNASPTRICYATKTASLSVSLHRSNSLLFPILISLAPIGLAAHSCCEERPLNLSCVKLCVLPPSKYSFAPRPATNLCTPQVDV